MSTYIVKKGDTLSDISKRYFGSSFKYTDIASFNQLLLPSTIYEGQTLLLPPLKSSPLNDLNDKDIYYVRYGDTLWKIADKMLGDPLRWTELAKLNQLTYPDFLLIGQPIKLPKKNVISKEKKLKKEQQSVKPNSEPLRFNQKPATSIPGSSLFIVSDEFNPFRPKLVRKDKAGMKGFQPKNMNSNVTPGRHVMGDNKSRFISTSKHPFGAPRMRGNRYWIDVNILKNEGVKFYDKAQIEMDFKRIEAKYHDAPHVLEKVKKGREFLTLDKEVLVAGPIKPGAVKTAFSIGITRTTQFLQGVGIVFTAFDLKLAAEESFKENSIKPLRRETIRQIGGWSGSTAGSWAGAVVGARQGLCLGTAVTVETGPGALLGGLVGAIVGGFVGYKAGDWIGGYIDEDRYEPDFSQHY